MTSAIHGRVRPRLASSSTSSAVDAADVGVAAGRRRHRPDRRHDRPALRRAGSAAYRRSTGRCRPARRSARPSRPRARVKAADVRGERGPLGRRSRGPGRRARQLDHDLDGTGRVAREVVVQRLGDHAGPERPAGSTRSSTPPQVIEQERGRQGEQREHDDHDDRPPGAASRCARSGPRRRSASSRGRPRTLAADPQRVHPADRAPRAAAGSTVSAASIATRTVAIPP